MLKKEELQKTPEYWLELIQNELYQQVTDYMEKEKVNQSELAQDLNVTKGYISQILKGKFNFTLKKLIELSLAINKIPNIKFETLEEHLRTQKEKNKNLIVYHIMPLEAQTRKYSETRATRTYFTEISLFENKKRKFKSLESFNAGVSHKSERIINY